MFPLHHRYTLAVIMVSSTTLWGCSSPPPGPAAFLDDLQVVEADLSEGDVINNLDQSFVDTYPVTLQPGETLLVWMESPVLDPVIEIVDETNTIIATDDDSGSDVNAFVGLHTALASTLTIRATTFEGQTSGPYQLQYGIGQIEWLETISGQLLDGDSQHPDDGSWMDIHLIEATAGQSLIAQLASFDFDAYLEVVGPDGQVVGRNDDHGSLTDAFLTLFLEQSGPHTLRINAFEPSETGQYTLKYNLQ